MMKKVLSFLAVLTILTGCYKITFVEQAHEVVKGDAFEGKIIVKRSGGSSNGTVQHVYGLFGLRVPKGWTSVGELVMTQVPKSTTNVDDEAYRQTITRRLLPNEAYTALLNRDYPREGYEWLGFVTDSDFKSLFNAEKAETEVDSIYATFTIQTTVDRTGVFYIDYVAGKISHDKLDGIGQQERDWVTRSATFSGDNISVVSLTDTRIRVTNADGSIDQPEASEPVIDPAWELEAMPFSTTQGTAYAYRDLKYNRLFTRTRGWNGGDGVLTVGLPNGDVFWTFNDSFYGTVNAADRSRQSCSFPRNSVMVQRAHDGVLGETDKDLVWLADYVNWTNPSKDRYFHCRTHLRHPQGEKTLAEIHAGDIDQGKVYWCSQPTVTLMTSGGTSMTLAVPITTGRSSIACSTGNRCMKTAWSRKFRLQLKSQRAIPPIITSQGLLSTNLTEEYMSRMAGRWCSKELKKCELQGKSRHFYWNCRLLLLFLQSLYKINYRHTSISK